MVLSETTVSFIRVEVSCVCNIGNFVKGSKQNEVLRKPIGKEKLLKITLEQEYAIYADETSRWPI